jgi:CubicO group peptidase (beta-lactamase class C family)
MLKHTLFSTLFCCTLLQVQAQNNLYFPPLVGNTWATTPPSDLGFCPERIDSLYQFLEVQNTKSFMLLKDGKIVLEKYFGAHTADSIWYWASAGKSLSAYLMGVAIQDFGVNIESPASTYLGAGWTSTIPDKEALIKVRHLLSMSSGLDDTPTVPGTPDPTGCTDPVCFQYMADAGTRWAYHNEAYYMTQKVIENASNTTINLFTKTRLFDKIGAKGLWVNHVMFSNTRSMARFGLLAHAQGIWNGNVIVPSAAYVQAMRTPSQQMNQSYGYLWWLNGQTSFMLPALQLVFPGTLCANAPADMYAALGKNDQKIHVVPSKGWVVVRMGNASGFTTPGGGTVPIAFDNAMWRYLNELTCVTDTETPENQQFITMPNPSSTGWQIKFAGPMTAPWQVFDAMGRAVAQGQCSGDQLALDLPDLQPGVYWFVAGGAKVKLVKI